jgi:4-alpha-glucanotransferase
MLDSEHRMNVPGVAEGNWRWQMEWSQILEDLPPKIQQLLTLTERSVAFGNKQS